MNPHGADLKKSVPRLPHRTNRTPDRSLTRFDSEVFLADNEESYFSATLFKRPRLWKAKEVGGKGVQDARAQIRPGSDCGPPPSPGVHRRTERHPQSRMSGAQDSLGAEIRRQREIVGDRERQLPESELGSQSLSLVPTPLAGPGSIRSDKSEELG